MAGLSTARSPAARGYDVRMLEARDRVGGRTQAGRLNGGVHINEGGQ